MLNADGSTLLTDKVAILERWAERFVSVLNRPSCINEDAIDRLPQIECHVLLDESPTVVETKTAVQQLSSGKASGADAIPANVYKVGGLPMAEKQIELFYCMWRKEAIPQEFKDPSLQAEKGILKSVTTTEASPSKISSSLQMINFVKST